MPDRQLKKAMGEIWKLMRRYRIGGAITLVSKTHAEFAYIFPDWSVIQLEGDGGVRIRSYEAYYGSKEKQAEAFGESVHCVLQMRDIGAKTALEMDAIRAFLEAQGFAIDHHPYSGFEPHEERDDA